MRDLSKYLINEKAKAKVKYLNKQADLAISAGEPADENLLAYKRYVEKFNELKTKYPNWEDHLDQPIPYSQFILDYNEEMFRNLADSSGFKHMSTPEFYVYKMHGVNEASLNVLYNALSDKVLDPVERARFMDVSYFRSHIKEAYQLLRLYVPNDDEYDNIFSPKEEMLLFG